MQFHLEVFTISDEPPYEIALWVRSFAAVYDIKLSHKLPISESVRIFQEDEPYANVKEALRLMEPFTPLMASLAPSRPHPATCSLFNYLYPQSFVLEATATQGTIVPRFKKTLSRKGFYRPGEYIPEESDRATRNAYSHILSVLSLNPMSSRNVCLLPTKSEPDKDPCILIPSKVMADGITCHYKPWRPGFGQPSATLHELGVYKRIADATAEGKLPPDLRICRLHGVVVDADDDTLQHYKEASSGEDSDGYNSDEVGTRFIGILLRYIENKGTLSSIAGWSDCDDARRHRWADELENLINLLHGADLVWGDAKPHNVLVDMEDHVWLIDFGGGYTPGWVEKSKQQTKEGDWQGLENIKAWFKRHSEQPVDRLIAAP